MGIGDYISIINESKRHQKRSLYKVWLFIAEDKKHADNRRKKKACYRSIF
jgi:hypothetical protein